MGIYHFDFSAVLAHAPLLLNGAIVTVELTVIGSMGGLLIGVLAGWGRALGAGWLKRALGIYVECIRNTPFLIQLSFVYFGLPSFGVRLDGFSASLVAIVLHMGAYNAEIVRAGIEATPRGQFEAAASMAMTRTQIFRHVLLVPALTRVWPALMTQVVLLLLDSAVCSQVSAKELTYAANYISSQNFRAFESYLVATAIYFALALACQKALLSLHGRVILRRRMAI